MRSLRNLDRRMVPRAAAFANRRHALVESTTTVGYLVKPARQAQGGECSRRKGVEHDEGEGQLRSARTRRALWAWIAVSVALLAHALVVGGGIAEPILRWQLRRFQSVDVGTTILGLLAVLAGIPGLVLTFMTPSNKRPNPPYDAAGKRRALIVSGACIIVVGGLGFAALALVLTRPGPLDPVQRLVLDELTVPVAQIHAVLVGVPRPEYSLEYDQVSRGWKYGGKTSTTRILLPITAADWSPGRQVNFIVDTRGRDWREAMRPTPSGEWITRSGYLLRWQLSDFERRALADQGLVLAGDVMLFSTDRMSGTEGFLAFAVICGCVCVPLLIAFIVTAFTTPRPR